MSHVIITKMLFHHEIIPVYDDLLFFYSNLNFLTHYYIAQLCSTFL